MQMVPLSELKKKTNAKCIFFLRAWLAVLYKVIYNVIGQILVRTYVEE